MTVLRENPTSTKFCPACQKKRSINLENINLELQHSLYAPNNDIEQKELTRLASRSTDKYKMIKCEHCQLEYASPMLSPDKDWYEKAYSVLNLYPAERWEFNYAIEQLKKTDLVGEIGCGSGAFLSKCQNQGIKSHGLDFSEEAIKNCLEHNLSASLIDITNSSKDESIYQSKKDHIYSFHTLEHLDNPGDLFKLASKWSQKNTNLWLTIPSDRRLSRLFKETDFLDQPPHHLTRWNPTSLKKIGHCNGWKLEEIVYEPIDFKTLLWSYTTRLDIYQKINQKLSKIWQERLLRYLLYPVGAIKWLLSPVKITGFSILARYSKQ